MYDHSEHPGRPDSMPKSSLLDGLQACEEKTERLHTLLDKLEGQVGPILLPPTPSPDTRLETVASAQSSVMGRLDTLATRLHRIGDAVSDLAMRIEL